MPMNRNDFINCVIDDGITEIEIIYTNPHQKIKREGGIAGFEACREKSDEELLALLKQAKANSHRARYLPATDQSTEQYWGIVMYERQVEWTINVLSAVMYAHDFSPLIKPTSRGILKAAAILGPDNYADQQLHPA